jgi:predicted nucleic acid-binding protein
MKAVVIDTSALIRFYVPDGPIPDNLESCIDSAWKGEIVIIIPELALAEVSQVLWKKEQAGYISQTETDGILSAILDLPLEIIGHYKILKEALSIARQNSLTVYDSLFLAVAVKRNAEILTSDEKMKKAFRDLHK